MSGISLLESALRYAQKGLPVFPCNPANKQPFTSHGFKDATPNPEHIRAWWTVRPEAMIGLPTGEASGLWVVDCDGAEGLSEFLRRCEEHDYTPETLYQDTPSGGRHYLFAWPEEGGLGNRARMWPSVDVRGEGGYIVAAPSCREDGRRYAWGNGLAPAPAPAWLLQAARTKERSEGVKLNIGLSPASPGSPYGRKALEEEAAKVRSAPRGERNDALNRAAFSLFQLVAGGVLEEQEVQATLERAAEDCGLARDDGLPSVLKTISSGRDKGMASPRSVPEKGAQEPETGREDSPVHFLPPPPPVPLEAFPPKARALLTEAAEAYAVPAQVPASTLLALLSCLVGRTRCVEVKRGWKEHGNIWVVLVASSGLGKTPVMNAFFQPVEAVEIRKFREWKTEIEAYNQEWMDYSRAKKEERGPAPKKPIRTQYYLDESTVEALADALEQNRRGVMWRADELSGLLASFDKYSSGKEGGTRARLLSAYDCQSWKSNRRTEERNLHIPAACVSIFGGIQPGMMRKSFDDSDENSGFLPRFMFIRAERERAALWSDETLSPASHALLRGIAEHLTGFGLDVDERGEEKPYPVALSSGAKSLFVHWYNKLAIEDWTQFTEGTANAVRQKLKGQAIRLCLLLHCLDAAISGENGLNLIPEDTMRRALLLADWVKENQLQTLALLKKEKARPSSPIECAIMKSLVADAERIEADGWKIANARLVEMVNGRLSVEVKPEQIGKAASALGLGACLVGEKRLRGRTVSPDKLDMFRATVSTVSPVSSCCNTRIAEARQLPGEPSQPSHPNEISSPELRQLRQFKKQPSQSATLAPQQDETVETVETVPEKQIPDFSPADGVRWIDEDTLEVDP